MEKKPHLRELPRIGPPTDEKVVMGVVEVISIFMNKSLGKKVEVRKEEILPEYA